MFELQSTGVAGAAHLRQQHAVRQHDVGDDAGGDDQGALAHGPVAQQVRVVLGVGAVGVVVGEAHVAAQRDRPQRVLHLLALQHVVAQLLTAAARGSLTVEQD